MKRLLPLAALAAFLGLGGLPCHWIARTAGAQPSPATEVRVTLTEWALSPTQITVPVGRSVRFLAQNAGILPHSLAVEGSGVYAESAAIGSGGSATLQVLFSVPGVYDLFCPLNAGEHRALGQEGTLSVLPATSSLVLPRTGDADPLLDPAPDQTPDPAPMPDLADRTQSPG